MQIQFCISNWLSLQPSSLVCFRLLWVYWGTEPHVLSSLMCCLLPRKTMIEIFYYSSLLNPLEGKENLQKDYFLEFSTNFSLFDFAYMVHRLGFIIDFLSKATLVGFMAGAAVIVSLQQLKGLLGIAHFTTKMQIVPVLTSVFQQRHEVRLKRLR